MEAKLKEILLNGTPEERIEAVEALLQKLESLQQQVASARQEIYRKTYDELSYEESYDR